MLLEIKRWIYKQPRWVPYAMVAGLVVFMVSLTLCFALLGGDDVVDEPDVEVGGLVDVVDPEPEVEPEPEPEVEPETLYTNPLTGEATETDISQNRPYAVMLNNLEIATPQLGVSQADIIFEVPAEGGITRMLGVFQSVEDVGYIGSVRSARDYFVSIAAGLDAFFLHAGGSPTAYTAISELGVTAFDCVNGPYEGTLYWRDQSRISSMGYEHSVITSGQTILEQFATYSVRKEHSDSFVDSFQFTDDWSAIQGTSISQMSVEYSYYKTGIFAYDMGIGEYRVSQYGEAYVDGNDGSQVTVKNVLVLRTDISVIAGDEAGRLDVRLTGSGSGILLCNGEAQEIVWERASDSTPFQLYDTDGEPLLLAVGTTYVNIVDESYEITLTK